MSRFDDTIEVAKAWLNTAGQKTARQVELQKRRLAIVSKQEELSRQYETLGKLYYRWQGQGDAPKGLAALCGDIDRTRQEIDDLKQQLEEMK